MLPSDFSFSGFISSVRRSVKVVRLSSNCGALDRIAPSPPALGWISGSPSRPGLVIGGELDRRDAGERAEHGGGGALQDRRFLLHADTHLDELRILLPQLHHLDLA